MTACSLACALPAAAWPVEGTHGDPGAFMPPAAASRGVYLVAHVLGGDSPALRSRPGGPVVARVAARTIFGDRPVLAVVRERDGWLGVLAPELPNGRLGWIPRRQVRLTRTQVSLAADLSRRTLSLLVEGRVVRRVRVAIGSPASPTPVGRFAVTDKVTGALYGPYYGCCILAFNGHQPNLPVGWQGGDRLGLHGTDAPWTIGSAASAGCLRASDRALRALMRLVPVGAPVFIRA